MARKEPEVRIALIQQARTVSMRDLGFFVALDSVPLVECCYPLFVGSGTTFSFHPRPFFRLSFRRMLGKNSHRKLVSGNSSKTKRLTAAARTLDRM